MKTYQLIILLLLGALLVRPAGAQSVLKQGPEGVVCVVVQHLTAKQLAADPGWLNPNVKGFIVRDQWSYMEPTRGTFDFSLFTEAASLAVKNHKFVGLSVCAGANSPKWLYTEGAEQYFHTSPADGAVQVIPEPWDPVFQTCWNEMITAFGQNFDANPNVAYVVMTGPGRDYEMGFVSDPLDIAEFELMDGQALWSQATLQITQMYVNAFPHTHLLYAMAPPTPDAAGSANIQSTIATLFQTYPHQFGVACAALAPTTDSSIPSVTFIQAQSSQATVGFQMYGPASTMEVNQATRSRASAETILSQALTKGIGYGAHYVEVYSKDCSTTAQQPNLQTANQGLVSVSTDSLSP